MYKIGDSVVYPMHGAGVIEDIEQKEVLGKNQSYYVIRIPIGDMKVMVPMDNAQGVGMRDVIGKKKAEEVQFVIPSTVPPLDKATQRLVERASAESGNSK